VLANLLILLAAQALPASTPSPAPPVASPAAPAEQHVGRLQIFIAPSGEAFRAPGDAPYPVSEWFARADANHDGKLTESEFVADFLRFFTSLDLDHDGQIDGSELERYENATPELHTGGFGGVLGGSGSSGDDGGESTPARRVGSYMSANDPQGAGRYDLLGIPEPVASMDTELKGRISRAQAQDAAEYRFSLLDVQHHGYLLLTDLPQTFAQTHRNASSGHSRGKGSEGSGGGKGHHRGSGGHGRGDYGEGGGYGN
jgi:Ca2+-binding EF-hand superfamily protein